MTTAKFTLVAVLIAGALSVPVIIQQQALSKARAEHEELEARLRDLPEPAAAMAPAPQADDSAQRNRGELDRLRIESVALRARLAELSVQVQKASIEASNAQALLAAKKAPFETLKPSESREVGQATPAALLQTFLYSMLHGDSNRIPQLVEFDPATDPSVMQKTLLELSRMSSQAAGAATNSGGLPKEIRLLDDQPAEANDHWLLLEEVDTNGVLSRERTKFRQTATGWKVLAGTNGEPVTEHLPSQP
jgi:hypothetical protein